MNDDKAVVIVTGSSGFIGSALIDKFSGRFRLVGFNDEPPRHPPPTAKCVDVDFTSDESVDAALRRARTAYCERIASVIHLAAYAEGAPHG